MQNNALFANYLLVMVASLITAVFVISRALDLHSALTVNLISATILVCGLGTLLQSLGIWKFGARLPFVMVPGGAPVFIFLSIAKLTYVQTASGAVLITAVFYTLVLPVFARCLRVGACQHPGSCSQTAPISARIS